MSAPQTTGISLKRAALVSIALHLCAAALLVFAPQSSDRVAGNGSGASSEAVRVSTIAISVRPRTATARARTSASTRTAHATVAIAAVPPRYVRHDATTRATADRPVAAPGKSRAGATVVAHGNERIVASTTVTPDPNEAGSGASAAPAPAVVESAAAIPVVASPPSPSPSPVATPVTVAVAPARALGDTAVGGWGQSFAKPLVEDDDELAKLRASIHSSGTVSIEVDEKGNATRVTLPASLASDARAELERRFLAMRYVPAECNGLRCTGTLQLTL